MWWVKLAVATGPAANTGSQKLFPASGVVYVAAEEWHRSSLVIES